MYRSLEYIILRHVMSYVVYIVVYIRVKDVVSNTVLRVKDSVVHCSRQQSLAAKWLGLCVHRVRARVRKWNFFFPLC